MTTHAKPRPRTSYWWNDQALLSTAERPRFSFFINTKAKVTEMKVNGATVAFKTAEDARNSLLRVSADITTAIATARELGIPCVPGSSCN